MFKNYVKVALRNLWKNRLFTSIGVVGLSIAFGVATLLTMDSLHELSYDNFQVQISLIEKKNLSIHLKTFRDPNIYAHDYLMIRAHRIFDRIEELIGKIDTIEGKKFKDIWNPYKKPNEI